MAVIKPGVIGQNAENKSEEELVQGEEPLDVRVSKAFEPHPDNGEAAGPQESVHTHCFCHLKQCMVIEISMIFKRTKYYVP